MAIDHEMRAPAFAVLRRGKARGFGAGRFGDDDGMSPGRADTGVETNLAAMIGEPGGAGLQILSMLRLGGDTGEAEEFAQLGHEAGLVAFQIIEYQLHGAQLSDETCRCQAEPVGKSAGPPPAKSERLRIEGGRRG